MKVPKENHQRERSNLLPIAHLVLYICVGTWKEKHTRHVAVSVRQQLAWHGAWREAGNIRDVGDSEVAHVKVLSRVWEVTRFAGVHRGPSCGASVHMEAATSGVDKPSTHLSLAECRNS